MGVIFILFLIPSLVLYGTYAYTSDTETKEVMTVSDLSISENPVTLVASAKVDTNAMKEACDKVKEAQKNREKVQNKEDQAKEAEPKKQSIFDKNGLLIMRGSSRANKVASMLLAVHSNGAAYHKTSGLDNLIDQLSDEECFYVLHKIEGKGFGQTASGYAGIDSPASHKALIQNQVNKRFGGKIQNLLKKWGTYSYGGY